MVVDERRCCGGDDIGGGIRRARGDEESPGEMALLQVKMEVWPMIWDAPVEME